MSNDKDFELSDLLESYLSTFNPNFLELLSKKEEYLELKSDVDEKIEKGDKGEFIPQKHQEFLHRFLRDYDDLLDFSLTGTGKTGSIAGFMEKALREHEKAEIDPSSADPKLSNFKTCLILFKGKTLADSFRIQLVSKISDGRYLKKAIEMSPDETNEKARKSAIKRVLSKAGYVVDHYEKFSKKYHDLFKIGPEYSQAENDNSIMMLGEYFADTVFWIDEGHNLNIEPGKTKTYKVKLLVYETLWKIFHYAPRCKRIISSATPAINNIEELAFLLNLILPMDGILPSNFDYQNSPDNDLKIFFPGLSPDKARSMSPEEISPFFRGQIYVAVPKTKIKTPDDDEEVKKYQEQYGSVTATRFDGYGAERTPLNLRNISEEDLEPYLRGRTFYIKNKPSRAVPVEQGIIHEVRSDLATSYITTFNTQMSEFQEENYAKLVNNKNVGFYDKERQAANFIYPNGSAGKEGFSKFIDLNNDKFSPDKNFKFLLTEGLIPNTKDNIMRIISNISQYSSKVGKILELLIENPGIHHVYTNYVKGSGGIALGVCLEMIGYERFNESSSVFITNRDGSRRIRIPKRKRYAFLSGDKTSTKDFQSMMELLNSDENMFGEYIELLNTSSTGREGVSIYNMIATNILNPEWNPATIYQSLSRGIRVDSQDKLLEKMQNIIDDLHNLLLNKFINRESQLYFEAKALIIGLSGGIKLRTDSITFDYIIETIQLAINYYKGTNRNYINKANNIINLLTENKNIIDKQKIINLNVYITTKIFSERSGLYFSLLQELDGSDEDLDISMNILIENIQYLIKELSIRSINIDVVNYYKIIRAEILSMISEQNIYQNDIEVDEYAPQAYLEIKIFKHAAIPLNLINRTNKLIEENKLSIEDQVEAIDLRIYKIGEAKHHNIEKVLSILRKNSVGSIIYANINKDLEETENLKNIDYNNYNILYSEEIISNIKKEIIEICRYNNIFTLSELEDLLFRYKLNFILTAFDKLLDYNIPFINRNGKSINDDILRRMKELFSSNEIKLLTSIINKFVKKGVIISRSLISEKTITSLIEKYKQKFIIIALERLINNKIQLTDKFGYVVYIRENNGYFYLDKTYPSDNLSDFRSSYYTDNLITIKQNNLENISNFSEKLSSVNALEKIKIINNDSVLINQYLESLSIKSQAIILESIMIEALNEEEDYFLTLHNNDNYIDIIINKYRYYIISMNEPYSQIKNLELNLLHQGPRPGRPSTNNGKVSLPNLKSIDKKKDSKQFVNYNDDTELIYIHTLYSQDTNRVKYGQVARVLKGDGRKRIIKITELDKGWRDMIDVEKIVYNELVQPILIERNNEIISHSVEIISKLGNGDGTRKALYGIIMDGEFRLVDKERENEKAKTDHRSTVPGRKGHNFKRPYLIEILWRLEVQIPESDDKGDFDFEITEENKDYFVRGLIGEIPIYYHGFPGKTKEKLLKGKEGEKGNGVLKKLLQREDLINYTYDELIEWDLYKLNFYYRWNVGKFSIIYMRDVIESRMKELDIIEYR